MLDFGISRYRSHSGKHLVQTRKPVGPTAAAHSVAQQAHAHQRCPTGIEQRPCRRRHVTPDGAQRQLLGNDAFHLAENRLAPNSGLDLDLAEEAFDIRFSQRLGVPQAGSHALGIEIELVADLAHQPFNFPLGVAVDGTRCGHHRRDLVDQ